MRVIREEDQDGMNTPSIMMVPLLVSWDIKRCNIKDCANNPTTIIADTEAPVFGMCEDHYQKFSKTEGKVNLSLDYSPIKKDHKL